MNEVSLSEHEVDMLIRSMLYDFKTFSKVERFISRMILDIEFEQTTRGVDESQRNSRAEWLFVYQYFMKHEHLLQTRIETVV
jgi:hypothetical protein